MIDANLKQMSFAILDRLQGIPEPPVPTEEEFPLPAWYRAVRGLPLGELGVANIARACRQKIHLEQVVPLALELLESEPLAGELYDGELMVSLKSVPLIYWSKHDVERRSLTSVVSALLTMESVEADIRQDAEELLGKLLPIQ